MYRLNAGGTCELCSSTIPYCAKCSDATTCEKCDVEIALMDNGKCTNCRADNGWFNTNSGTCKCNNFVDTYDKNKCKSCSQLMPGCEECEATNTPGVLLNTKIGNILGISNSNFNYVKCTKCESNMYFKGIGC
jgi:hypothetical protein